MSNIFQGEFGKKSWKELRNDNQFNPVKKKEIEKKRDESNLQEIRNSKDLLKLFIFALEQTPVKKGLDTSTNLSRLSVVSHNKEIISEKSKAKIKRIK